ncbi:MAG: phosphatidate cytidylyltransferase [Pseudomonadota bacterium]
MVYQSKSYNFVLRVISALILVPLVLLMIKLSGMYFTAMLLAAAIIMGGEWYNITYHQKTSFRIFGGLYILLSCLSLLWIIDQHHIVNNTIKFNGVNTVMSIFVIVWANDVGGYIFGRTFGGKLLCPKISPNKTWAGFFGGVIFAILISPFLGEGMGAAGIAAMIASLGDLLESWTKRKCKVKDSGQLIPGHGGLLDRVDGVLLLSIVVAALGIWFK